MIYSILVFLNIGTLCLLLGGMIEVTLVEIPLFQRLSHEYFVKVHSTLDQHMDRYMPLVTILGVLSGLGEFIFGRHNWQLVGTVVGVICLIIVALISHLINVPLNRQIRNWKASSSANLLEIKMQWVHSHYMRTIVCCIGFLAFVIPVVSQIS